jgi:hypothetical protein
LSYISSTALLCNNKPVHKRLDTSTIVTTDGIITSGSAIQLIQPFDALIRAKLNQFGGGAR